MKALPQPINLDELEELERRLLPLLKRRGVIVEDMQPIGLIGRGQSSSVFSVVIDGQYHVLKVYTREGSYRNELRNRRRLIWPPEIVLQSRRRQNSLGLDLILTKVPEGRAFCSDDLLDWVAESLGQHLIELHHISRKRQVSAQQLIDRFTQTLPYVEAATQRHLPKRLHEVRALHEAVLDHIKSNRPAFRVTKSLVHGDLWWGNVIIAKDEVFLIDWETVGTADYLEDIAQLRIMLDYHQFKDVSEGFWRDERNTAAADRFFRILLDEYRYGFDDDETIDIRLPFYLVLYAFWRIYMKEKTGGVNKQSLTRLIDDALNLWPDGFEYTAKSAN